MTTNLLNIILDLLKHSKENEGIRDPELQVIQILEQIGAIEENGLWKLSSDVRIELAILAIQSGGRIESVVDNMTWKDFEGLVGRVLGENGFHYIESFRRRGNEIEKGMEIDVIGVKGNLILSIDAKMWGIRNGKTTALRNAVDNQIDRTERLASQLHRLSEKLTVLKEGEYSLIPAVVTWLVEDIELFDGVPIIPVFKLNSFLLEFDQFQYMLISIVGKLGPQYRQSRL